MIEVPTCIDQGGDRAVSGAADSLRKFIHSRCNSAVHYQCAAVVSNRDNVCAVSGKKEDSIAEGSGVE